VRVLRAQWHTLREDECAALGVMRDSPGWVREVYLLGDEQPWIFARSVATRQALLQAEFEIGRVGAQSLGEVLFGDARFTRGPLELCWYPPTWLPPEVRTEHVLARRSCFSQDALGVLVVEVGLPALWARLGLAASTCAGMDRASTHPPRWNTKG